MKNKKKKYGENFVIVPKKTGWELDVICSEAADFTAREWGLVMIGFCTKLFNICRACKKTNRIQVQILWRNAGSKPKEDGWERPVIIQ